MCLVITYSTIPHIFLQMQKRLYAIVYTELITSVLSGEVVEGVSVNNNLVYLYKFCIIFLNKTSIHYSCSFKHVIKGK
jgi:hypothetical protein